MDGVLTGEYTTGADMACGAKRHDDKSKGVVAISVLGVVDKVECCQVYPVLGLSITWGFCRRQLDTGGTNQRSGVPVPRYRLRQTAVVPPTRSMRGPWCLNTACQAARWAIASGLADAIMA